MTFTSAAIIWLDLECLKFPTGPASKTLPDSLWWSHCLDLAGKDEDSVSPEGQGKDQAQEALVSVHVHVLPARPQANGASNLCGQEGSVG